MAHKTLIDIKGYEGLYAVTPDGKVWSYRNNRWLTPRKNKVGYLQACLCKDGVEESPLIHRLVAQAFIPNPNEHPCINHINEDKSDNRVENLEWCTYSYNNAYNDKAKRIALNRDNTNRIKASVAVCSKPVLCVELGQIFKSTSEAARQFGISHSLISRCCSGKRKTTGGYHWKYAEVSE